jgi:hypothetical protein
MFPHLVHPEIILEIDLSCGRRLSIVSPHYFGVSFPFEKICNYALTSLKVA